MLTRWQKLTVENLEGELDNISNTLRNIFAEVRINGVDERMARHLWEVEARLARWIVAIEAFNERIKTLKGDSDDGR